MALAFGARTGERTMPTPSVRNTSSKHPGYFESRSWIRNRTPPRRSSMARLRACWVTHAESGWAVTPAMWTRLGRKLDEEQHEERSQHHGLDEAPMSSGDHLLHRCHDRGLFLIDPHAAVHLVGEPAAKQSQGLGLGA